MKLPGGPIADPPPNAVYPTPGQGLTLDPTGRLHSAVQQTLPGYEYSYVEFTADVSVTATASGSANTVVTAAAVNFDGATIVLVEFFCSRSNIGSNQITYWLYQDGAETGRLSQQTGNGPTRAARRLTPAAGSHTYSIRGTVDAGTGTAAAGAGAAGNVVPGFIRIARA